MTKPLTEKEFKKFADIYAREKGFTEMRGKFPHERLRATIEQGFASVDLNRRAGELMCLEQGVPEGGLADCHEYVVGRQRWNPTKNIRHALTFAAWAETVHGASFGILNWDKRFSVVQMAREFCKSECQVTRLSLHDTTGEAAKALTEAVLEEVETKT